jgi:hypothetical protein
MEYMGQKFAQARYDPCCYLLQSRSMDLMDIGFGAGSHAEGTRRIDCERVFACAILQDELIPSHELEDFAQLLATRDGGGSVVFEPSEPVFSSAQSSCLCLLPPRVDSSTAQRCHSGLDLWARRIFQGVCVAGAAVEAFADRWP